MILNLRVIFWFIMNLIIDSNNFFGLEIDLILF